MSYEFAAETPSVEEIIDEDSSSEDLGLIGDSVYSILFRISRGDLRLLENATDSFVEQTTGAKNDRTGRGLSRSRL